MAVLERLDLDTEKPTEEELARKFGYEDAYVKGKVNWWHRLKPKIWSLMDEPYSSNAAKVKICMFVSAGEEKEYRFPFASQQILRKYIFFFLQVLLNERSGINMFKHKKETSTDNPH